MAVAEKANRLFVLDNEPCLWATDLAEILAVDADNTNEIVWTPVRWNFSPYRRPIEAFTVSTTANVLYYWTGTTIVRAKCVIAANGTCRATDDLVLTATQCKMCEETLAPLVCCSRCKCTFYCSKECQRKNFEDHRGVCKSQLQL
jgi:hypothetical protein